MTAELQQCVLASGNAGKLAELSNALAAHGIDLRAQSEFNIPEADEPAVTFVENALIKARHASNLSGLPALADDSGLVVPALNGEPGVRSARYAAVDTSDIKPSDLDNTNKLLRTLALLPQASRAAYFVCLLVYVQHADDPLPMIATGIWHGTILDEVKGDGGFGYDPAFYCPATGMTAAEMGKQRKQEISHRALALRELNERLRTRL